MILILIIQTMSGIATPPESDAGSDLTEHHQDVDASVPVPPDVSMNT